MMLDRIEIFPKYRPYLDPSLRALPHHYRPVQGRRGAVIKFTVPGERDGQWWLYATGKDWILVTDCERSPACEVVIEPAIAWRIFSKSVRPEAAEKHVQISGDQALGEHFLSLVAVMA